MENSGTGAAAAPEKQVGAKCTACCRTFTHGANYCVVCGTPVSGGQDDTLDPRHRAATETGTDAPNKRDD